MMDRRPQPTKTSLTDSFEFAPGYSWSREGNLMKVTYPTNSVARMPKGYVGHAVREIIGAMPGVSFVWYKIEGWSADVVRTSDGLSSSELVAFVRDTGLDSHKAMNDGNYTIPVLGRYQYKLAGLKAVQSDFKAGDVIPYELEFIFKEHL